MQSTFYIVAYSLRLFNSSIEILIFPRFLAKIYSAFSI